jgi:hypothetical protein
VAVDRSYVGENNRERERLRALVTRLSDAELARPLDAGWTIAGILGHLAFWDQRIQLLIERWQKGGAARPPAIDEGDVDLFNDMAKPLILSVAPRRVAELAVAIAETVDRMVETLPDRMVAENEAAGHPVNLVRAAHRREHLDEIEQALRR